MLLEKWLADISEWLPESSRLTKPGLGKVINSCQRANKQESLIVFCAFASGPSDSCRACFRINGLILIAPKFHYNFAVQARDLTLPIFCLA